MKTLYLECYSGISGDMTVAALLDLGASEEVLRHALESLQVPGYTLHISRVNKMGVMATDFDVQLDEMGDGHGHPHDHGHDHEHAHDHEHNHEHSHDHEHDHDHHHHHHHHHDHSHPHVHRGLPEILEILSHGDLTPRARQMAEKVFRVLAEAEGTVHGLPPEEVHFHEVGAVDSIVDIVGACVCLDNLGIEEICHSEVYEGTGWVNCAHGRMPVPAPAVMQLARLGGFPLRITEAPGEMVTPTGAAILTALARHEKPGPFTVQKIGVGAGKKDFAHANILRAMLIEPQMGESDTPDEVVEMTSHIDDATGEELALCREHLLQNGALDAAFSPLYMKKGRPAWQFTILCRPGQEKGMARQLFLDTTAIGVRYETKKRFVMERQNASVATPYGDVLVKVCRFGDVTKTYAEYESAKDVAEKTGAPLRDVMQAAVQAWRKA